ncbi:hypothetical protein Tco_0836316 [Tanacetum coccineum]
MSFALSVMRICIRLTGRKRKTAIPGRVNANMALDLMPTEDVLPWPGNANMAFRQLLPTEDVLPWGPDVLRGRGMEYGIDVRLTKTASGPGNANMAFDLRPTETCFRGRPTEDVLPWPGNANMTFDLRPTEDVLPCPGHGPRNTELTRKVDPPYVI